MRAVLFSAGVAENEAAIPTNIMGPLFPPQIPLVDVDERVPE